MYILLFRSKCNRVELNTSSDRSTKHWRAHFGEHHLYKDDPGAVSSSIQTIIVHENYDPRSTDNDIALVRLEKSVTLNNIIDTVCLPITQAQVDKRCFVTGFGEVFGEHTHMKY